jgi:signal transduction histidine kinase
MHVPARGLHGLTIKAALVLGFSLTLGVWLFTGYDISRRMSALRDEVATLNVRYTRAQDLLSTVRAQVLLGSVYVRDALLDATPAAAAQSLARLEQTSRAVDRALAQYEPVFGSDVERARLERLRREVLDFRNTMNSVLASDPSRWTTDARLLLNTRVVPRRETVIRVSEDVQALNRQSFVQQQVRLAALYVAAERRTWQRLGLSLAGSLGIALLATIYGTRLEQHLRRQREKERQNAADLQRLSAKLLTVQEEERRTIARELHDEVGQVLTAIKMELSVAQRSILAAGVQDRPLQSAQTITDTALHTVRDLSRLLHPAMLDDLGLPAAVRAYTQRFAERHGIKVNLSVDNMEARADPPVEAAAYRIIQESLTNIARHAEVATCCVRLRQQEEILRLEVEDEGKGFDLATHGSDTVTGLGLIGMRERASLLGGRITVSGAQGHGTRVIAELPVHVHDSHPATTLSTTEVLPG